VPTLKRLAKQHRPAVFCPLGVARQARRCGLSDVYELDWGQSLSWRGLRLHCVRAQHSPDAHPSVAIEPCGAVGRSRLPLAIFILPAIPASGTSSPRSADASPPSASPCSPSAPMSRNGSWGRST
jgi:hypothetical protein